MIRIQTTYSYGKAQVERVVEINDLGALTSDERTKIFDLATRVINSTEADDNFAINTSESS